MQTFYLGTPGMSREAGGSDHRARDRSLPGNKIFFQVLSATSLIHWGGWVQKSWDWISETWQCQNGRVWNSSMSFLNRLPVVILSSLFVHKDFERGKKNMKDII